MKMEYYSSKNSKRIYGLGEGGKEEEEERQTWTRGSGSGLHRFLCMQGGDDDGSYAKNSEAPASAITLSKPLLLTAIESMKLFFKGSQEDEQHDSIRIVDLGCATGYNTLATMDAVVDCLRKRYSKECGFEPEFEAFFSDLPSNDFNSLFRSLANTKSSSGRPYYAAGVPGSFYRRLFPKQKLHVAVSLSALHWLSQVHFFFLFLLLLLKIKIDYVSSDMKNLIYVLSYLSMEDSVTSRILFITIPLIYFFIIFYFVIYF